ncbi:hypothetical protein [Gillisia marina]|uniref:hypothetical protein n=1 Tax=Gillisia marina TaxID=1167637 RepID=UPI00029A3B17|nr:hypothetical protein [Gillisia marina]
MKKNYFFLLFFVFIAGNLLSQEKSYEDKYLDSLRNVTSDHLDKYEYKESIEVAMLLLEESKKK